MTVKNLQLEIVEYDKKYATIEQVTKIFWKNYEQQTNVSKFAGIYGSLKSKYGNLTYLIFLLSILLPACLIYFILSLISPFSQSNALILSLIISSAITYYLFAVYCVNKLFEGHLEFGKGMLKAFTDIKAKYQDKGGNFWLVLVHNPVTGQKEIVAHVALAHDSPEEKEYKAANPDEKTGYLEMMGVNEEYRGMGIGKKLIQTLLEFAERNGYHSIGLGALEINYPAVEMYKKIGFKITREIEVDRWVGVKAILMRKYLV